MPLDPIGRYARQAAFAKIGAEGQKRIGAGSAAVVGLGALGSASADRLARAGVGRLRLIDFDTVELSNLQRQCLYTEDDAAKGAPTAEAAARHLSAINSDLYIEGNNQKLDTDTVEALLADADVVIDGTDNMEARYIISDFCADKGVPWVYGAVAGASGFTFTFVPGGPSFRGLYPEPPENYLTAATSGIIGPAASFFAAIQAAEALKILSGHIASVRRTLLAVDLWENTFDEIMVT
jgi:adenylyltransferase/sulfurtransferase